MKLALSVILMSTTLFLATAFFVRNAEAVYATPAINPAICEEARDNNVPVPAICDEIDSTQTAEENVLVGSEGLITRLVQALAWISAVLAVILIIIAGLMFVFSQGNAESAGRARSTIIYALIGLAVAVSAQILVTFVLGRF